LHHRRVHAIRQYEFGPVENLRYEELPDPEPGDGQVRIAVEASGVHVIDTAIRRGERMGDFPLPELPMIPGREVAGVIDAVGRGVDEELVGRRIVAHLGSANGGYADRAVVDAQAVHEIPDDLAADAAVATIGTVRTAVAVLEVAELTANDVVLVTAAAGGLGSLFVQAGKNAGGFVVGLAGGSAKVERVRALGADVALDYSEPDWPDRVREALGAREPTLVLDGVGGDLGHEAMRLLGVGGRLVLFGSASGRPTEVTTRDLAARSLTATWAIGPRITGRPGRLRELESKALAEVAAGRLVPFVGQRFPLAEAAAAHTAIETRATVGKTVLVT
jgi:NADPH2:quinone reductase